jgi:hypothetical protein
LLSFMAVSTFSRKLIHSYRVSGTSASYLYIFPFVN